MIEIPLEQAQRLGAIKRSYEMKIDDLARETLRCTVLVRLVQRLFDALEVTAFARNPFTWTDREWVDFVHRGIPPDERDALRSALVARGRDLPGSLDQERDEALRKLEAEVKR